MLKRILYNCHVPVSVVAEDLCHRFTLSCSPLLTLTSFPICPLSRFSKSEMPKKRKWSEEPRVVQFDVTEDKKTENIHIWLHNYVMISELWLKTPQTHSLWMDMLPTVSTALKKHLIWLAEDVWMDKNLNFSSEFVFWKLYFMLESQSCVFVIHAVIFHVRVGVSRRCVFVVQDVELMHAKGFFSIRRYVFFILYWCDVFLLRSSKRPSCVLFSHFSCCSFFLRRGLTVEAGV